MKKLLCIAAILFVTGCSAKLNVKPTENLKVEYGEKLDTAKLFISEESDENVKVSKIDGFDEKKLGEQELNVTFTDGDKELQETVKITVEDTKKPEIELKKDSVTINEGDNLDLADNIKSVKDPIDGNLKYRKEAIEKDGYYIDKGKLNLKKEGKYDIKIIAIDKNGNKAEKTYKVNVVKKKKAVASSNNVPVKDYSNTNSTQPNASSTQGLSAFQQRIKKSCESRGGKFDANTNTCHTIAYEYVKYHCDGVHHIGKLGDRVVNDAWFDTYEELEAYVEELMFEYKTGGNYGISECECGKMGITIGYGSMFEGIFW